MRPAPIVPERPRPPQQCMYTTSPRSSCSCTAPTMLVMYERLGAVRSVIGKWRNVGGGALSAEATAPAVTVGPVVPVACSSAAALARFVGWGWS